MNSNIISLDLSQFLFSASRALDAVEEEVLGAAQNHSRRVAYLSVRVAKYLGFSLDDQIDLAAYACLHDNALTEYVTKQKRNGQPTKKIENLEDFDDHCIIGEKNITAFPFLGSHKNIILYHHENYDGSGMFGKKGEQIPLMSRILRLADHTDVLFRLYDWTSEKRSALLKHLETNSSVLYDPVLIGPFNQLFKSETSQKLKHENIEKSLKDILLPSNITLTYEQLFKISTFFAHIIDYKSPFTLNHSIGIAEKTKIMSNYYELDQKTASEVYIAAFLHDIGKLAIPDRLLEKPGKLTIDEYKIVKKHVFFTHEILKVVDSFHDIEIWASNHHERLDGSGYFRGSSGASQDFCSRLLECIDIFQALVEDRPYRSGMDLDDVFSILNKQAEQGKLDKKIVADIDRVFHKPIISSVLITPNVII